MDAIRDFEDILTLLHRHRVRYLIIGGLAFIYHAKPRYTKDMDLWIESSPANRVRANRALAEFGSPVLLTEGDPDQIVQLGVEPNRIDLILRLPGVRFLSVWPKRIRSHYGKASANWIDLDSLIRVKQRIDHPRHQEDVRVLRQVRARQKRRRRAK